MSRRLAILLAMVGLLGSACGGAATTTQTSVPSSAPSSPKAEPSTVPATATLAPVRTPRPTPTTAATIGQPADDGARIIAVDTPSLVGAAPNPRARDLTIDSPAVGGTVQVRLLLPADFDAQPETRWPVLYLLDGQSGTHLGWTNELIDVTPLFAPTDLLVVMPDCGLHDPGGCSYTDWWNGGKGGLRQWETFHLVELRQLLERNWQAGDRRAIAGVSAGGYGAIEYAARQPGLFRFAASYSGVSDPLGSVAFWNPPHDVWGDPVAQVDIWKAHDPFLNAAALKGTGLYIAYGNGKVGPLDYLNENGTPWDPGGAVEHECGRQSAALVHRLKELKIPVTADAYGNGTHSNPYIWRDLERSLPLILKALDE
jgi:diacylglycerol O-acyltransferase / trehalose O-mycolyltransferase